MNNIKEKITTESLEQKISIIKKISFSVKNNLRSNLASYLLAPVLALGIAYCGSGPSEYCCGTIECESQGQECDGEDETCYCREKTCCERITCNPDQVCDADRWGDTCGCVQDPNLNRYDTNNR